MHVTLFVTCVVDLFQPEVGVATVRVLRAGGCEVSCPLGQTCCGQPAWNSGHAAEAAKVARTTLDALEGDGGDVVVVPAGSCATMIRVFWPELFEVVGDHDAADRARRLGQRTKELSELLVTLDLPELHLPTPERVAYHHSCHMLRELDLGRPAGGPARAGGGLRAGRLDRRPALLRVRGPVLVQAARDQRRHGRRQARVAGRGRRRRRSWGATRRACCTCAAAPSTRAGPLGTRHLVEVLAAALPGSTDEGNGAGPDGATTDDRAVHAGRHEAARPDRRGHPRRAPQRRAGPRRRALRRRSDRRPRHPRRRRRAPGRGSAGPPRRPRRRSPTCSARFADNVLAAGGHVHWAVDARRRQRLHHRRSPASGACTRS